MKKNRGEREMDMLKPGWLYGWKDIASYIGCTIPTVHNYHAKHGLPVNRLPGGKIIAHPDRIDDWINKVHILAKQH